MTLSLITGGAGFIGSNFIHYIIKHYPDYRIINFDALTYAGNLANLDSIKESDKYRFIHTRIESTESLNIELENETVDYIINFAAESHVDRSIISSHEFVMTNIVGGKLYFNPPVLNGSRKVCLYRLKSCDGGQGIAYQLIGRTIAVPAETKIYPII